MNKIICVALLLVVCFSQTSGTTQPSGALTTQQTARVGYGCMAGYYWTNQSCFPCQSVANGICQCSAYLGCTNLVCNANAQLVQGASGSLGQCVAAPTGCVSFGMLTNNSAAICYTCTTGYTLLGGICVPNNNCANIILWTGQCSACQQGFYYNYDLQLQITSGYSQSQYYLNFDAFCQPCMTGCQSCTSQFTCAQCQTGYTWAPSSATTLTQYGSCVISSCGTGQYVSTSSSGVTSCATCFTGCGACTSSTTCTSCSSGYYLTGTTTTPVCTLCSTTVTGCATCNIANNVTTCQTCASTYFLNTTSNTCTSCSSNCTTCTSATACTVCATNYQLSTSNTCYACPTQCATGSCTFLSGSQGTCSQCNDLYYLTSTTANGVNFQTCTLCSTASTGSLRCYGPIENNSVTGVVPTQCANGYFLYTSGTTTTCVAATSPNTCLTVGSTAAACATCLVSTTSIVGTTCQACPSPCSSCTAGTTTCSACISGYYFVAAQGTITAQCQSCSYSNTTATTVFAPTTTVGCSTCSVSSQLNSTSGVTTYTITCNACAANYFLNTSTGVCSACATTPSACVTCVNASGTTTPSGMTCNTCAAGYFLNNGDCFACQANCATCYSTNLGSSCTSCVTGYFLLTSGGDVGCVSYAAANCLQAGTSGCNQCAYGFQLVNGECIYCLLPVLGFVCRTNPTQTTPVTPVTPVTPTPTITGYNMGVQTAVQTPAVAYQCVNGYYWTQQSCMPCATATNGYCTCTSLGGCTTTVCNSGYQLINNTCTAIPTGCSTYTLNTASTAWICTLCQTGYTLLANICIPNNNCTSYSATTGLCQSCSSGYYLNYQVNTNLSYTSVTQYFLQIPSSCVVCGISNCSVCPSQYTCTTCSPGYYWQQSTAVTTITTANSAQAGQCEICVQNCSACTSLTTCTACNTGYYFVNPNAGLTVTYSPLSPYCVACTTYDPNCTQCSATACTTCNAGYQLFATGAQVCVTLPANCSNGTATGTCQTCMTGFYPLSNTNCSACPNGCATCQLATGTTTPTLTCLSCSDQFYLTASGTTGVNSCTQCSTTTPSWIRCVGPLTQNTLTAPQPTQCQNGYYLISQTNAQNITITSCAAQPTTVTCLIVNPTQTTVNTSNCASCISGQVYNNGSTCYNCTTQFPGCTSCTLGTTLTCSACATGYYITSTNTCTACSTGCTACSATACTTCSSVGFYLNSSNSCSACIAGCSSCTNSTSCTTCSNGYYPSTVTTGTTTTTSNTICLACQPNCATCVSPGSTCATCAPNFVLTSTGGCLSLASANCMTSSASSGCTQCIYGYQLVGGVCTQCISPQSNYVCRLNQATTNGTTNGSNTTNTTNTTNNTNGTTVKSASLIGLALIILVI